MKTIFAFLAAVAFDAIAFTYLYLTDNGGLFAWTCALAMIFLTFAMAIVYEPAKYVWFFSYEYRDEDAVSRVGRHILVKPYKEITPRDIVDVEDYIENTLKRNYVVIKDFKLINT